LLLNVQINNRIYRVVFRSSKYKKRINIFAVINDMN
jgi:hypothetical protein